MTWAEAEAYLNKYAKVVGFSLRQKLMKMTPCTHSGKPVNNQVIDLSQQRNYPSRKILCPWHVKPKSASHVSHCLM